MKFTETPLRGAFVVEPERMVDERGFFARTWCREEFQQRGLAGEFAQCSISFNARKGTLRGMHYQIAPHAEAKLVRCTLGSVYDVIIDLRHDSPSFKRWFAVELTETNRRQLYVPVGFAHGFQTLQDDTELFYQISCAYAAEFARGVRWNDPEFGIVWPDDHRTISSRDQQYPNFIT